MATPARVMRGISAEDAEALQAHLDQVNEEDPPEHDVPYLLAIYRHKCPKARRSASAGKGVSAPIGLHERYVVLDEVGEHAAIVYREGRCKRCQTTCRSASGWVVSTSRRPPAQNRVARD